MNKIADPGKQFSVPFNAGESVNILILIVRVSSNVGNISDFHCRLSQTLPVAKYS